MSTNADIAAEDSVELMHIDQASDEVREKMLKILAHAYSKSGNENEMNAAMAKAKALADKHRINLATVSDEDVGVIRSGEEPIVNVTVKTAKGAFRRPPCHKFIGWTLQKHFYVKLLAAGSTVWIVGRKSDADFAEYAYFFLHRTFNALWRDYKHASGAPMEERNSFFIGLHEGLDRKLSQQAEETERTELERIALERGDATIEQLSGCVALAIVGERERVSQALKGFHPIVRTVRTGIGPYLSDAARANGYRKGQDINIVRALKEKGDNSSKLRNRKP